MDLKACSSSVRKLAAHPLCPLSKTRLDELLAAHFVRETDSVVRRTNLSPSHVAVVARLEPTERRQLLEAAFRERLGVRELKLRARAVRNLGGVRRGRPPTSLEEKALTRLENAVMLLDEGVEYLVRAGRQGVQEPRIAELLENLDQLVQRGMRARQARLLGPRHARVERNSKRLAVL